MYVAENFIVFAGYMWCVFFVIACWLYRFFLAETWVVWLRTLPFSLWTQTHEHVEGFEDFTVFAHIHIMCVSMLENSTVFVSVYMAENFTVFALDTHACQHVDEFEDFTVFAQIHFGIFVWVFLLENFTVFLTKTQTNPQEDFTVFLLECGTTKKWFRTLSNFR